MRIECEYITLEFHKKPSGRRIFLFLNVDLLLWHQISFTSFWLQIKLKTAFIHVKTFPHCSWVRWRYLRSITSWLLIYIRVHLTNVHFFNAQALIIHTDFITISSYYWTLIHYFFQIATSFLEMLLFHLRSRLYIVRMAFVSCQDILVLESCKKGSPASSSLALKPNQQEKRRSKIPSKKKPSWTS